MIKNINKFKKDYMFIYNLGDNAMLTEIQKLSRMKKKYINRFDNLKMSDHAHMLLIEDTARFMGYTNGVGSEVGWFNRTMRWLIPSWIRNGLFGVDITPASDLHDVEYSIKIKFTTIAEGEGFKDKADLNFRRNMITIVKRNNKANTFDSFRFVEARLYYLAVGYCGSASFWKGKTKPII